ncbi:hypothetical protein ACIQXG_22615 [Lysinibacillus sphaericus]|uniref:hypothetical protein n=1 Tax=Lysinibacillus sphaericus TaxID=1421 RepID=UPI0038234CA2
MKYDFVTGTGNAGDLAAAIVDTLKKKFPGVEEYGLVRSLTYKLKAILSSTDGSVSWSEIGGILLDIARFIVEVSPVDNVSDVVSILWTIADLV